MEKDAKWARWKQHRPKIQEQKEINEFCRFVQTPSCFCFHSRIYACDQPETVSLSDEYSSDDTAQGTDNFLKQSPVS